MSFKLSSELYYMYSALVFLVLILIFVISIYQEVKDEEKNFKTKRLSKRKILDILSNGVTNFSLSLVEFKFERKLEAIFKFENHDNFRERKEKIEAHFKRFLGFSGKTNELNFGKLFDQVLRYLAEDLESLYEAQNALREKEKNYYGSKEKLREGRNSLTIDEIRRMLESAETLKIKIRSAEKSFWDFHNALEQIGIMVWGHKGPNPNHKPYLLLQRSTDI
jgi:hypothetical protein